MFGFGKKKTPETEDRQASRTEGESKASPGLFARLRSGLARTRANLSDALGDLLAGKRQIDDELLEEIETLLLTADVGVDATRRIIDDLTGQVHRRELSDPQALSAALKARLTEILRATEAPVRQADEGRPQVILMVGINGAGKTTTIGKLARR
ncbi:MAG: signal recognition particle receptor subunit alpha, partial [Gammaproteobacteria bacterium]|nr:signal recognition particle receptor subunit alpha [Gammaproteobacteria bacterium]